MILDVENFSKRAVRHSVYCNPLSIIWSALTGNLRHSFDCSKIHLNPLWFVICSCRPCTSPSTACYMIQSCVWSSMIWRPLNKIQIPQTWSLNRYLYTVTPFSTTDHLFSWLCWIPGRVSAFELQDLCIWNFSYWLKDWSRFFPHYVRPARSCPLLTAKQLSKTQGYLNGSRIVSSCLFLIFLDH